MLTLSSASLPDWLSAYTLTLAIVSLKSMASTEEQRQHRQSLSTHYKRFRLDAPLSTSQLLTDSVRYMAQLLGKMRFFNHMYQGSTK